MRQRSSVAITAAAVILTAGCAGSGGPFEPELAEVTSTGVVSGQTPLASDGEGAGETDAQDAGPEAGMELLAANTARTFFADAPAAVVCGGSEAGVARGTELAAAAGAPLLCGPGLERFAGTLDELGTTHVFAVEGTDTAGLEEASDVTVVPVPADAAPSAVTDGSLGEDTPRFAPVGPAQDGGTDDASASTEDGDASAGAPVVLAVNPDEVSGPARATAAAAGARLVEMPTADPRATSESVAALAGAGEAPVIALGDGFGSDEDLAWKIETAATGIELPGGGQLVAPGKTYIALYGTPGTGSLGLLGEQDVDATIARAQEYADLYDPLLETTVVPSLEIIASVAIGAPGRNGTYSNPQNVETLKPLVDAAHDAGQYVVLDLQPGREDFVTQAKYYEELLELPNVGLALDPEWRLKPDEVHLRQVGQVDVAEVNEVVTWLADLTRENDLPQKFLVLHSFQNRMITGLDDVDQSRDELAVLVHVDGQGGQQAKQGTWRTLHQYAPSIEYWGWKNFIDEDVPMLTPQQTVDQVEPAPVFVSYQ